MKGLFRSKLALALPLSIAIALFVIIIAISHAAADSQAQSQASCSNSNGDNDESCTANENTDNQSPPKFNMPRNGPIQVTFQNNSPHRADIYFDDGRFGTIFGTVENDGGEMKMNTFPHLQFFVTLHGVRENLVDPNTDEKYSFIVKNMQGEQLFTIPKSATPSKTKCKDRYPICTSEAQRGECTLNPGWMIVNCCQSCDTQEGMGYLIDERIRCDPIRLNSTVPAWKSGSLNELFEKWATGEEYTQYAPKVISSPNKVHGAEYDGPWIMIFDNFLDDYEARQLITGGTYGEGYQRSTDQGKVVGESGEMASVTSSYRTSSNAWCNQQCESLPGVQRVTKRIEEVTGIPKNNYEAFQILKYEEGQFYKRHHDSSKHSGKAAGHRILTFFLYLNDVEEGGETRFTHLDISVAPKKGRALVWPSVKNDDPGSSDTRMYHEAKAVIKGKKYAANHWTYCGHRTNNDNLAQHSSPVRL